MAKKPAAAATPETAAAPAAEKVKMPSANGVTMPGDGTKTRRVWQIADTISATKARPALRYEVMTAGEAEGLSKGTIATQYGKWCTFYGVDKATKADVRKAEKAAVATAPENQAGAPTPEAQTEG